MSCSQVFLTYKRKRLTGTGPAHGNGCNSSLSTCPNGDSFTSLKLHGDMINEKTLEDQKSNGHFLSNNVHSKERLSSDSTGTATDLIIDVIGLQSSLERRDGWDCDADSSCILKTLTSEKHDSLAENNNTVCGGLVKETRSTAPLITFSRKNKRKMEDKSGSLVNKYQKGCPKGHETESKPAAEVDDTSYSSCLIEGKVTVVDSTSPHARVSLEAEILILESERQHDGESTSENALNVAERVPERSAQDVVHIRKDLPMDSLEAPLGNTVKASTSGAVNAVTQGGESHACKREESKAISNDGKKVKIGGSLPFLDLSVTPTVVDSSGALDCNINMDSSSQNPSFYGRSNATALDAVSSPEVSDVRNERCPSFPSKTQTDATAGVERTFLEESSSTCKDNYKSNSVSMNLTCKNKCLQLFPEDKSNEVFQVLTTQPHRTAFTAAAEGKAIKFVNKNNKKKKRSSPNLGLSLPIERKSTAAASVNCLTTFPLINLYGETREFFQDAVPQSSSNNLSSGFRHGLLDNILTCNGALNERDSFQDNLKSYATSWTEEELDFLWIGVRRHGVHNWGAMLKDRKLHFSTFRVARDLAERWEVEQSKLFKDISPSQSKHSKIQSFSSNLYNSFPCQTEGSRKEDSEAATRLSLGEVYTCGESNGSRSSRFESPYLSTNLTEYLQGPFLCPTRDLFVDYRKGKYETEPPNHSRGTIMPDYNPLRTDSPTTSMARRGNLPHWIKEAVCAYPSGLTQPNILPGVSLSSQPQNLHATYPYFYPFELQSGPRNEMYHLYGGSSRGQCFNGSTGISHGKAEVRKASSRACPPENVIVINSDASSEETISDDHGARK